VNLEYLSKKIIIIQDKQKLEDIFLLHLPPTLRVFSTGN